MKQVPAVGFVLVLSAKLAQHEFTCLSLGVATAGGPASSGAAAAEYMEGDFFKALQETDYFKTTTVSRTHLRCSCTTRELSQAARTPGINRRQSLLGIAASCWPNISFF